jgi:ABC-type branched-subunit amino acid transport system substrate-binding protein
MVRRWWIAAAMLAWPWLLECNALRSVDECKVDLDCPRGTVCAADRGYCRTGGPITIGYLAGVTGPQASITQERRDAIEFGRWVVERDPALKVLGRGLDIHVEDTLGTLAEVPAATTRLLDHNIAALIGPGPSAEVLEAQKETFARRMLHLAPSGAAPSLGDAQPADPHARFLFQMVIGVPEFVPTIPLFLASTSPERPSTFDACFDGMAIVVSDDTLGNSLENALAESLGRNCVPVTQSLAVPATKKASYAEEIDALVGAERGGKPTRCLFLGLPTDVAGELLRALKAREESTSREPYSAFIGGGTLNAPSFFEDAKSASAGEPSLAEGFYGVDADGNPDRAELRDLEELWREYLSTQSVLPQDTPLGANRVSYAEAVIVLALAIELAGTVDDPVLLRDAFVDVTGPGEGDRILGPKDVAAAFALIRAARKDGRRAAIDYRGSYSNLDFDSRGFVRTGTMAWRARNGRIERVLPFSEEEVAAAAGANPGPACARKP